MNRRKFIRNSGIGVIGSAYVPSFLSQFDLLNSPSSFKKLVVIQLSGGNDGLNTVVPFENDRYFQLRPNIHIPKNEVIKMDDLLGFNPVMSGINQLFLDGQVAVLNNVGYPNPNRSHFRSMDIWHSGSDSDKYINTGWVGRYLDAYCQDNHAAVEIDSLLSMSLEGEVMSGIAANNSTTMYRSLRDKYFREIVDRNQSSELSEDNLGYLYKSLSSTYQSAKYLKESHKVKEQNYDFPKSKLGRKLSTVSQFIRSDLSTQVYYVTHGGFDSHANQRNKQDRLLKEYSDGVFALVKSLEKSGHLDDTLIMTFSEFGRRVQENASMGTDHGKANNLFLIGNKLRKTGVINSPSSLGNLDDGDIPFEIDFRNVYSDIIKKWFKKDPTKIISKSFSETGII